MNEKEIIMDELDTVETVIELVPEKKSINFGKVSIAVLVTCAVAALGYKGYKLIKAKNTQKAQEDECTTAGEEDFENSVAVL